MTTTLVGCGAREETPGDSDAGAVDSSTRDTSAIDSSVVDTTGADVDRGLPCGDAACASDEICIRGRCAGCCDLPPACIKMPTGCAGAPACGCFATDPCGGCTRCQSVEADGIHCGECMCKCSAPWTLIDTPDGPRRIADLRIGDLVYSVHRGARCVVPLSRVGRRAVSGHAIVRVTLGGGATVEMSGSHPTADGRTFATLSVGTHLGDAEIVSLETVRYDEPFTYDVLPASDTGTYFSSGAWLGSTMHVRRNEAFAAMP